MQLMRAHAHGASILAHFLDMWNLLDIINISTLIVMTMFAIKDSKSKMKSYFWAFSTICSFIIWAKLLYFFRWYKSFNWMIDMVKTTLSSNAMWAFIGILVVTIFAFASAFNAHATYVKKVWSKEACEKLETPCTPKET